MNLKFYASVQVSELVRTMHESIEVSASLMRNLRMMNKH
jgi:hypothetical protein